MSQRTASRDGGVADPTRQPEPATVARPLVYAPSLAAPAAGLLADRVRHRPQLVWVNLAMALMLPTLLPLDRADRISGTALALSDPAENALSAVMFDQDFRYSPAQHREAAPERAPEARPA